MYYYNPERESWSGRGNIDGARACVSKRKQSGRSLCLSWCDLWRDQSAGHKKSKNKNQTEQNRAKRSEMRDQGVKTDQWYISNISRIFLEYFSNISGIFLHDPQVPWEFFIQMVIYPLYLSLLFYRRVSYFIFPISNYILLILSILSILSILPIPSIPSFFRSLFSPLLPKEVINKQVHERKERKVIKCYESVKPAKVAGSQ